MEPVNQTTYQSSKIKCVANFLRLTLLISFVMLIISMGLPWLLMGSNEWQSLSRGGIVRDMLMRGTLLSLAVGIIMSFYLAFFRHRIRIVVAGDAVSFFRGKREYAYFPHDSFFFRGYIHTERAEGVIPFVTRYLQVFTRYGIRGTVQRCYNFDADTYSALISHVRAASIAYDKTRQSNMEHRSAECDDTEQDGMEYAGPQPNDNAAHDHMQAHATPQDQTFHIHRERLLKRHRSPYILFLLCCFMPAFIIIVPSTFIMIASDPFFWENFAREPGLYIVLLIIFLIPLIITGLPPFIYGRRYHQVKRTAPERVELHDNKLLVDNAAFYFDQIQQIKLTPPNMGETDTHIKRRILTIHYEGVKHEFVLSDSLDNPSPALKRKKEKYGVAFAEYPQLYNALQQRYVHAPDKFVGDLS